jgi:CPA2 family monovalent cation:H+ antiporter-2
LLEPQIATSAIAVAGLSMMLTPLLAIVARRLADHLEPLDHDAHAPEKEIAGLHDHIVIGGFGRVGQAIARVLDSENVPWIAFDSNGAVVTEQRDAGRMVYFGDASRREILSHSGWRHARAFVVTLGAAEATERMVTEILALRPKAQVLARAKDVEHAERLIRLGAIGAVPETVEASLQLVSRLLEALDFPEEVAIQRTAEIRMAEVARLKKSARAASAQ